MAADTRQAIRTERPPSSVRNAALAGGTLTILLMGVVVLSLTPNGVPNPTVAGSSPVEQRVASAALGAPSTNWTQVTDWTRAVDLTRAGGRPVATSPEPRAADVPLATGLADGGLAVLPSQAVMTLLGERGEESPRTDTPASIVVVLHDGSSTTATVVDAGDGAGLAVVRFDQDANRATGFTVAPDMPADDEMVTVMTAEPIDIEMHRLDEVDPATAAVVDGTAVLDADGNLVGLLTNGDDGSQLLPIDDLSADLALPADDVSTSRD